MKNQKLFILFSLLLAATVFVFTQCRSKDDLPRGEERITVLCSDPEYRSDSEYFRANSSADSPNMSNSKRMAVSNARADLAGQIEVTVKAVIDNYVQDITIGDMQEYQQRYEGLSREVINQKLTGTRIICEETTRTDEGRYRTYVAIELSGSEILSAMNQRIRGDERLRLDYDYDRFKNTFEDEMRKLDRERN